MSTQEHGTAANVVPGRRRRWAFRGLVALGIVAVSTDMSASAHTLVISHTPVQSVPADQAVQVDFTVTDDCDRQDPVTTTGGSVQVNEECDPPSAEIAYWTSGFRTPVTATISGGEGSWSGSAVIPSTAIQAGATVNYSIHATQRMNGTEAYPTGTTLFLLCRSVRVPTGVAVKDYHDVHTSHGPNSFTVESADTTSGSKPRGHNK